MFNDRYIIIYYCKLPYIFLEDLDQIYPKIVVLMGFEHFAEDASAIFYAVECLSYEVVTRDEEIAFLQRIGNDQLLAFEELGNPNPFDLVSFSLLVLYLSLNR